MILKYLIPKYFRMLEDDIAVLTWCLWFHFAITSQMHSINWQISITSRRNLWLTQQYIFTLYFENWKWKSSVFCWTFPRGSPLLHILRIWKGVIRTEFILFTVSWILFTFCLPLFVGLFVFVFLCYKMVILHLIVLQLP